MQKRSPAAVLLLPLVTFGIYQLYWYVKTKGEMVAKGANIPSAWLLIVPFANIYWMWKYSEGVEQVTNNKYNTALSFIMLYLLGSIGSAIIQDAFNKLDSAPATPVGAGSTPAINPMPPVPAEPVAPAPTDPTNPLPPAPQA